MIRSRTTITALLFALAFGQSADSVSADPQVFEFHRMTAERRAQTDAMALNTPDEKPKPVVESYDDVQGWSELYGESLGWLIARTPLPPEEEFRRALTVHEGIVKRFRVVDTPANADRILKKLVTTLPARMRAKPIRFSLTVLDNPGWNAFTVGGGYVYITRSYLSALTADEATGDLLAFVLAHELGHICRKHCRHGYRLLWLKEELHKDRRGTLDSKTLQKFINKSVHVSGQMVTFLYNRTQRNQADLFALHLCRNAGFDLENCLDLFRQWASTELPAKSGKQNVQPLRRLKQARMELDGVSSGHMYGLFAFDPATGRLTKAKDDSVRRGEHVVVFVHGLESDLKRYRPLMSFLAKRAADVRILGFQFPNDQSLARTGKLLKREVDRVCRSTDGLDFVCHSAGGLAFRYYAAIEGGRFRKAIFQGTPHGGSDLAKLQPILEAKQFFGGLRFGFPTALEKVVTDGQGQMNFDLQPESLFLQYLNRASRLESRDRYYIFRGKALKRRYGLLLGAGLLAARAAVKRELSSDSNSNVFEKCALTWFGSLRIPKEVTNGDLAVTLNSAALKGAAKVETFPLNHLELTREPDVMKAVVEILIDTDDRR